MDKAIDGHPLAPLVYNYAAGRFHASKLAIWGRRL
jgi:hypothetical protein